MSKKYSWKDYDWNDIQKYHDEGNNRAKIKEKFGCAYNTIKKAEYAGLFVPNIICKYKIWGWKEIQKYHDNGYSTRKLTEKFGIGASAILAASKRGDLKLRCASEACKLSHKNNPRQLTQVTKNKISISRIAYLEKNPSQVPYLLNHYSKKQRSYPEEYFYGWLVKENIKFQEQKQISYYAIDFYINNKALEIDGEQHYVDCRIWNKDRRRDKYLIDKGIITLRVRWSCYQRLSREEKEKYLIDLKIKLNE